MPLYSPMIFAAGIGLVDARRSLAWLTQLESDMTQGHNGEEKGNWELEKRQHQVILLVDVGRWTQTRREGMS